MFYVMIFLISVFISSVSQIILKTSADKEYENKIREYLNLKDIVAYGFFFLSSLMTICLGSYTWKTYIERRIEEKEIDRNIDNIGRNYSCKFIKSCVKEYLLIKYHADTLLF